ncbi:MAG: Uma2 family endonuclease [Gemmatimonadales bacterium]
MLKGPFTVESFQRLGELGILGEDDRVELIDGQVVEMTPIGAAHVSCVNRLNALFAPLAGREATLSVQNPLVLSEHQEPQPDFTVLRHRPDGYRARLPGPTDVLLVIEVADTSLAYDRDVKIPRYARASIPEAWLVDLTGDRIGVYREPRADAYSLVHWAARGEILTPLLLPQVALAVTEILG